MKLAHNVRVTVFEHSDSENQENITKTLEKLFPFEIEKFFIKSKVQGFNEKEIITYEVYVDNNRLVNDFLKSLMKNLSKDDIKLLSEQKQSRLDSGMNFFIRLDKNKLLKNIYEITDSGDCFHVRLSLAPYPKKEEIALKIIDEILNL